MGDMLHLFSIFVLLLKIYTSKNCNGLSLKTQFLYVVVFCTRYLDLMFSFISLYNEIMKVSGLGIDARPWLACVFGTPPVYT